MSVYKKHLLFLLLMISSFCYSQEKEYIFGQLVDSAQNVPVPFASIRIKDRALGVISNIDGTFKIPLRYRSAGDIIQISCMGYISKEILIDDLKEQQSNIIVLRPGGFELGEAVVSANIKKMSARQIVKIAVNSIPQNYPQSAFCLVGYYRDYQVKNGNYINLNEAIIKIMDLGFDQKDNFYNKYQLFSYSKNADFETDIFARKPYDYKNRNKIVPNARMENDGGNEFITLSFHDAIRNYGRESFSFIDNMVSDFVENHVFNLRGTTNFNKEKIYEIHFTFRNDHYKADGNIFIGKNDFAILKLDYSLYKLGKAEDSAYAVNASERYSDGFKKTNQQLIYHIQTEYTKGPENKMYLNYISFYNKVLIQRPAAFASKFVINVRDSVFKIKVSKIPTKLEKIKPGDFRIRYKKKLIPVQKFTFLEDERTFIVVPNWRYNKTKALLTDMFTDRKSLQVSDIRYSYRDIKDSLGNELDKRLLEYMHQYREFFRQEIRPKGYEIKDVSSLMIKDLPLDDPKQPISNEAMKSEYWKNTPLPTFKN